MYCIAFTCKFCIILLCVLCPIPTMVCVFFIYSCSDLSTEYYSITIFVSFNISTAQVRNIAYFIENEECMACQVSSESQFYNGVSWSVLFRLLLYLVLCVYPDFGHVNFFFVNAAEVSKRQ